MSEQVDVTTDLLRGMDEWGPAKVVCVSDYALLCAGGSITGSASWPRSK